MSLSFELRDGKPEIVCRVLVVFEDKNRALELLANAPRYRPRTRKHIALKYHHFSEHVRRGLCRVIPIDKEEQIASRFPDLPLSSKETNGLVVGLRGSAKIQSRICKPRIKDK